MKLYGKFAAVTALITVLCVFTAPIAPAYAYSSEATVNGEITSSYNSVLLYGPNGYPVFTKLTNTTVYVERFDSKYTSPGGTVSQGDYLKIEGSNNYLLHVSVKNASAYLGSVTFDFGGTVLTMNPVHGDCSAFVTDRLFASGKVDVTVSIGSFETDDVSGLTLGDVKFTLVSVGSSDTIPPVGETDGPEAKGASVTLVTNTINKKISVTDITTSEEAEDAFDEINGGVITDNNVATRTYVIEAVPELSGYPSVVIKYNSEDNVDDSFLPRGTHDYNVTVKIPANVIFCIKTDYNYGGTAYTYYSKEDSSIKLQWNEMPGEEKWIVSGENGYEYTMSGKDSQLRQVHILVKSVVTA